LLTTLPFQLKINTERLQVIIIIARKGLIGMKIRKLKTTTLVFGMIAELIFSVFLGLTAGARGLGSLYPALNLVAKPFVCPNSQMSYTQNVSEIGSDTYWTGRWFCVDEHLGVKTELDPNRVFLSASPLYTLVFFAVLLILTYVYWNSSIGPAKNDGLHLG
jgi:hypothetical protein